MFNSSVLDLIILLAFTYFVGSLLLSSINESITQGLRSLRQTHLKAAIENLLFDEKWKGFVQNTLMKSPQILSLMKDKNTYPAYIPANNFVLAVIEQINPEEYTSDKIQNAIEQSALPEQFKKVLKTIATKATGNL